MCVCYRHSNESTRSRARFDLSHLRCVDGGGGFESWMNADGLYDAVFLSLWMFCIIDDHVQRFESLLCTGSSWRLSPRLV